MSDTEIIEDEVDDSFDDIIEEHFNDLNMTKEESYGKRLVEKIEAEHMGLPLEAMDRARERKELEDEIKNLTHKLSKCKNVKNFRQKKLNKEISEKRKKIRNRIQICKVRLQEIDVEEGKDSSSSNVNDTVTPVEGVNNVLTEGVESFDIDSEGEMYPGLGSSLIKK